MKVDSLDGLKCAFADWRRTKKYKQEAIPASLLARAQRCMGRHGLREVVRVTGVDRSRLLRGQVLGEMTQVVPAQKTGTVARPLPGYTRVDLPGPSARRGPIAELETGTGVKLRVFEQTPEMLGLLGVLCGIGGMTGSEA